VTGAGRRLTLLAAAGLAIAGCTKPVGEPPVASNVILFVGDGMGVSTVTAARIFDGQSQGKSGEEHELVFETFGNVALVKTYNTNQQVPDSAGTATAMVTGEKTRAGVINVGPAAARRSCDGAMKHALTPIATTAAGRDKAIGVVTTTRITHATPAAMYASSPERDWESNRFLPSGDWARGCRDIAWQLLNPETGTGPDVALGGGRREFYGTAQDGTRLSSIDDLVAPWLAASPNRRFVRNASELAATGPGEQVLGLFAQSHMTYVAERPDDTTEPTLAAMTAKAIELLSQDPDGYLLMVEGGRIDHGHHIGKPAYALLETQAFVRAIETALDMVDTDETLVPMRSIEIDGSVSNSETHAGEDVALYATGPGADAVRGVIEQDRIYDIMMVAFGWDVAGN